MMKIAIPINKNLFNILVLFTREPFVRYFSKELEFYRNESGRLIGFISLDYTDNDYYAAILSRDKAKQYRAEKVIASLTTIDEARKWIDDEMASDAITMHDDKSDFFDLFEIIIEEGKLSPYFKILNEHEGYLAAKNVIKEISYHYKDIDGNFIDQFQSINGFDARLWELYLFCFCREQFFSFKRDSYAPDFMIEKLGHEIAIEAVIVGRKDQDTDFLTEYEPKNQEEIEKELKNDMPLKFGSALYSKLKKEYWKKDHVKGKPLVIAVADFHETKSMLWSYPALISYLYGYEYEHYHTEEGQLVIIPVPVKEYTKSTGATVPAGFFFQPDAENISAVINSPTATLSKFNRLGMQAGLNSQKSRLFRFGYRHDHDENAAVPLEFAYEVTQDSIENWSEGISIFHNPNALIPLDPNLFKNVTQHFLKEDGSVLSYFPEFHPYKSMTINQLTVDKNFQKVK
ncbi:glycosaminoglycan attachment site [uncultured Dysgonomonas sp.]|uniref:Glycosaminoglycan attachment site n=1 Tax=uncultured Dysgonomonas sp. TaxID=206096 RepID=A0A212JN42_9BACT|nr:glycosaminoglycan attachment site [uncultured Dysgonomonas sp.]SBW00847.1 Glycosaminoglycan attachment site [uncultured Dysgonomonas sp.]